MLSRKVRPDNPALVRQIGKSGTEGVISYVVDVQAASGLSDVAAP